MPPNISTTLDMAGSCNQTALKSMNSTVSSCSLKRKRPPKIEIPMVLREIVTATELSSRDCQLKADAVSFSFSGFGVGVASVKGKKSFMEDAHKIVSFSHGNKGFFGVYDGHGGSKAAEFVAENLHSNVFEMLDKCSGNTTKEEAIKAGFLKTDEEFLKQGLGSGACCVTAFIEGNELVISNVGDCRAVLSKGGKAEALTRDHRAANKDERQRIEDKGGYVENHRGAWRIHGILAVSRSIGDAHLKDWVVAEPDTKILQLTTDMEYVVLASDGLWEEVGNQEAIDVVMRSCAVDKTLGLREGTAKVNDDELGCVMSPATKLQRISLVKPKKQNGQSPCYKKTVDRWKESENDFGSENESPLSKARRISKINQIKMRTDENADEEIRWKEGQNNFGSENECNFGSENEIPPIKARCHKKTVERWNEGENDFDGENKIHPSKARRISTVNLKKVRTETPDQGNNSCKEIPASDQLVAACKELVNLAVNKGSLDDITVMIIDLNHFKED